MTGHDDIRRHPDGAIDFDAYRAEARALRREAMRRVLSARPVRAVALATVLGGLGLVLLLAAGPGPHDTGLAATDGNYFTLK